MFRKRSRNRQAWKQGNVTEFVRLFILPFLKHKPEQVTDTNYIDAIWRTEVREIKVWNVLESFKCMKKSFHKGGIVVTRTDPKMKGIVEMSVFSGAGKEEKLFRFTEETFDDEIRPKLQERVKA